MSCQQSKFCRQSAKAESSPVIGFEHCANALRSSETSEPNGRECGFHSDANYIVPDPVVVQHKIGSSRNARTHPHSESGDISPQFEIPFVTIHGIRVMDFYVRRLKQIFWVLAVAVVFILGAWFGIKVTHSLTPPAGPHKEDTVAVIQQIQTLSDLVTVKYVLEKVEIINSPPTSTLGMFVQGENRILLLAHGVVKAGIDLRKLKPQDVAIAGKKIMMHLPPPQITDAYLDENQTKVIDWQRGFLRDFDQNLETTARQDAVDDIRRAARSAGILKDANERAQQELAVFLNQAGYEQVVFVDKEPIGALGDHVPQY